MPRLLDVRSRADTVIAAIHRLIAGGGLGAVTMRAIAAESGVSASSLVHQFTGRDRLLGIAAGTVGVDRLRDIGLRARSAGLLAFVPTTTDEIVDARVWLAFCELGRSHEDVGLKVAAQRMHERDLIDALTRDQLDEPALDGLVAIVDGLCAAVCAAQEPLPTERAKQALVRHVDGLGIEPPLIR